MVETFQIQGLDEIMRRMKALPGEINKKAARSAARKAMNIVRDAARAGARQLDDPETAANIAKNIAVSESGKQGKQIGGIVMRVGVRGGGRLSRDPANTGHWRFLELGTSQQRAQPFMLPALESNVGRVTEKLVAELNPAIDKVLAKLK